MELCEHRNREHETELTLFNVKTKMYNIHPYRNTQYQYLQIKIASFILRKQITLMKIFNYSTVSNITVFALSLTRAVSL